MTPEQERQKLAAEHTQRAFDYEQKFAPPKCIACKGRGLVLMGAFPTKVRCQVCGGPNVTGGPETQWDR